MTPDTLQEPEFFSAAAVIAGALWAITTVLFSFIAGGIIRSGLLTRVGIGLLLISSSLVIVTISTLFLGATLIALSMLMPTGPGAHVQGIPGGLALLSLCGVVAFTGLLSRQKARERLGKAQMVLIACCIVCWFFIAVVGTGSSCIARGQDPDFNGRFCRALGFSAPRADIIVVLTITAGCLLSLFLGIVSMQTELIASITEPKPQGRLMMAEEKTVSSMTLVELREEADELNRRGPGQRTPWKDAVEGELKKRLDAPPSSFTEAQILEQMDYLLLQAVGAQSPRYLLLQAEFERGQLQLQTQAAQKTAEFTRRTAFWMLVAGIATAASAVFLGVTTWMNFPKRAPSKTAAPPEPDAGKVDASHP
jgi:hypothetical protein